VLAVVADLALAGLQRLVVSPGLHVAPPTARTRTARLFRRPDAAVEPA